MTVSVPIFRVASVSAFQQIHRALAEREDVDNTTSGLWFRGHARHSWLLLPTLYRSNASVEARYEREMTRDFRLKGAALARLPVAAPRIMFLMQHYGLPTRLLDWTENALAALFFAVEFMPLAEDGCVWVLSPWKLNQITAGGKTVPTAEHLILRQYLLVPDDERVPVAMRPLAVRSAHDSPRIRAQSGVFTIHGKERISLDQVYDRSIGTPMIGKIVIEAASGAAIRRELYGVGVSRGHLFPELSGVAADIVYRYSSQFFHGRSATELSTLEPKSTEPGESQAFPPTSFKELMASTPVFVPPVEVDLSIAKDNAIANARALARQLVERIKNAHPDVVAQGLITYDLYTRLREQIELARRNFDRETAPFVRDHSDVFTEVLVEVLAAGEYWRLGLPAG